MMEPTAKPQFLHPVASDLASNFSIPADFFKYLEGERCEEVQLRVRRRRRPWVVSIKGRRMVDGWEEFVIENELHVGEFLLFRYEGHMLFDVTIFGPTACEREYPMVDIEEEDDVDGLLEDGVVTPKLEKNACIGKSPRKRTYRSSGVRTDGYVSTMKPSYMRNLYFPIGFILENQLTEATSGILIQDETGKTWPVELGFKRGTNVVYTNRRDWMPFVKEIGLKLGDDFGVRVISKGAKPVLAIHRLSEKGAAKMSGHRNRQNDDEVSEPEIEVVPETAKRQEAEEGPARATKRLFKPVNKKLLSEFPEPEIETAGTAAVPETRPEAKDNKRTVSQHRRTSNTSTAGGLTHFSQTSTWPSIERSRLIVNIEFVRANDLINKCGNIILKNLKGESWPANLRYEKKKTNDCYYIGSGWRDFALGNGLGVGCRFKMEIEQPESEVLAFKLCECTPRELNLEEDA